MSSTIVTRPFTITSLVAKADTLAWLVLLAAGICLWTPNVELLCHAWRSDPALSFGPVIPLISAWMIWTRRAGLMRWSRSSWPAFVVTALSGLLYAAASWADIVFLKLIALIMVTGGAVGCIGGLRAVTAAAPGCAYLLFAVPWPTSLTERLAFPLQLASSAYAAQFAGMLGIPIVRQGVQLAVMPHAGRPPLFSIIVAGPCSGLTSTTVLLALAALIAFATPALPLARAALVLSVLPLALVANAFRLTLVLVAGTYHSPHLAAWVHDHEQPVLVALCSLGLVGIRHVLLCRFAGPVGDLRETS